MIVGNAEAADNVSATLKTMEKELPIFIAPDVCSTAWSSQVRKGIVPEEDEYGG